MSIDAVAVLRIAGLPEPATPFGTNHPVEHRGDASLVNLMQRFDGADPDEALRAQTESAMADWKPPPDWLKQE